MSTFGKKNSSFRLYDKDSYVFSNGKTASEIINSANSTPDTNAKRILAEHTSTGIFQARNPKLANFASPSTFGAFGTGMGNGITYTSPGFYSPIHTATNWQIPTKRREVYMWCVTPETTVVCDDGNHILNEEIQKIKIGTKVLTHNGNFKTVHSVFKRYVDEEIYKITVNGKEDPILITENHEIFGVKRKKIICDYQVKRKHQRKCVKIHNSSSCHTSEYCFKNKNIDFTVEKIKAKDLSIKDYVYEPVLNKEAVDPKLNSYDMARFLGYYLAEGHCYICEKRSQWSISFDFHSKELFSYGKELESIILNLFDKKPRYVIKNNSLRITFTSKEVCKFLLEYIPGNAKNHNKMIHKNIMMMPKEWMYHFLGAYLNGDGSYVKNSEISSITSSYNLATQIKQIYNKLGICTSKIKIQNSELNGKIFKGYVIYAAIGQCSKLSEYCNRDFFSGFKHKSKTQSFIKDNKNFNYIKKIEKIKYKGYVYCLGVEDDESFVANGISISNCRFFSQNDPTIAASMRFYSQFPFAGFENVISDPIRKEHYDKLKKRLQIEKWLPMIAYEYFTMGDAFPFVSVECEKCNGFDILPDGSKCSHENGRIAGISLLNPDWIDVKINPLDPSNPIITLIVDDTLKNIVWSKEPFEVFQQIPNYIKQHILANKPIRLNKNRVQHLKHDEVPYMSYGRSLLAPLFPILAYQDRLRQAQWIVAERHILPIKICKIGNDQRPAGAQDIADTQRMLAATQNDPNLTLVTHHAFSFEWTGAAGKVLQLTKEYELIEKAIIKGLGVNEALLSGTGPSYCFPQSSRILTSDGFKNLEEFDKEKHLVATLNPDTHKFEWGKATEIFVFNHDSINGEDEPLVHFKTKGKIDCIVTKNHEMYVKQKLGRKLDTKYTKVLASEVKDRSKFILKTDGWDGIIPSNIEELTNGIDLDSFLQLASYFITEGSYLKYYPKKKMDNGEFSYCHEDFNSVCKVNGRTVTDRKKIGISFSQNSNSDIIEEIFELKKKLNKYGINLFETKYEKTISRGSERQEHYRFSISSTELAEKFNEYFGEYSYGKRIPKWIKDLPQEYLEKFIYHCVKCDGHERKIKNDKTIFNLTTVSEKLCEDYYEILLKSGNAPIISYRRYSEGKIKHAANRHDLYEIYWSDTEHGNYPKITSQRGNNAFSDFEYSGKVWCVSVPPNHLILVERNGRAIWTGNSQAAIGIEATIKRLKTVQNMLSDWIMEKIYKVEARINGFYKEDLQGNRVLDYPDIRWNDLNLRDESQRNSFFLQLWDKKIVSTQFICEKMQIDYDVETERVRLETEFQQQMGIAPGDDKGGKGGGLGGGLGGGFGGGGKGGGLGGLGGGLGGDSNKGNMPGGGSAPGLPGDSIAPSMSGGDAGDYKLKLKSYEQAKDYMPKVHSPRKYKVKPPKEPMAPRKEETQQGIVLDGRTGQFRLTSIETALYKAVKRGQDAGNLPLNFIMQQKPEPVEMAKVSVDGFFPDIKLIIEADGGLYHSSPEQIAKDQERDSRFNALGWTVLRFKDEDIENNIESVLSTIIQSVKALQEKNKQYIEAKEKYLKVKESINREHALYSEKNKRENYYNKNEDINYEE